MAFGLRQKILDREAREKEKRYMNYPQPDISKGDALRRMADFVDDNEALFNEVELDQSVHISTFAFNDPKERLVDLARAASKARGIEIKKEYVGKFFSLYLDFNGVRLELWTGREQVCEKRVTGTQTVTKKVAIEFEEQEIEEEIVEWDCHPLLKS